MSAREPRLARCLPRAGLVAVALLAATPALACKGLVPPLEQSVQKAERIFLGTLLELREPKSGERVFVFSVEETLKGGAQKTVEVVSDTSSCGLRHLEKGHRYLMFTYGPRNGSDVLSPNQDLATPEGQQVLATVRGQLPAPKR